MVAAVTHLRHTDRRDRSFRVGLFHWGIDMRIAVGLLVFLIGVPLVGGENWPRFRGPDGSGISDEKGFPLHWDEEDFVWKTELPGIGQSSPCVWGEHVFLTSAKDEGRKRYVLDLDVVSGKIRWAYELTLGAQEVHHLASNASPTPTTEGTRVYVRFTGSDGVTLLALDFRGELVWKVNLGPFDNRPPQGCGASPVVFDDLVIIMNSQETASSIIAVDSATGKERWKVGRPGQRTCHSTPIVLRRDGVEPQLLFSSSADGLGGLDPRSGKIRFRAPLLSGRVVGSPVYADGVVFGTSGGGGKGRSLAAVSVDSRGDLQEDDAAWTSTRELPYVPTPIAHGGYLYTWADIGVVKCIIAKTGEKVWLHRVGGAFSASPIWVDEKLYCVTRQGDVVVIQAGPKFRILARNSLGEESNSTPAVAGGRMFFRGVKHAFCLPARVDAD